MLAASKAVNISTIDIYGKDTAKGVVTACALAARQILLARAHLLRPPWLQGGLVVAIGGQLQQEKHDSKTDALLGASGVLGH